jgi:hypothetical protein
MQSIGIVRREPDHTGSKFRIRSPSADFSFSVVLEFNESGEK